MNRSISFALVSLVVAVTAGACNGDGSAGATHPDAGTNHDGGGGFAGHAGNATDSGGAGEGRGGSHEAGGTGPDHGGTDASDQPGGGAANGSSAGGATAGDAGTGRTTTADSGSDAGADGGMSRHGAFFVPGSDTILVTKTIGAPGGTITGPAGSRIAGVSVTFPAGALQTNTQISLGFNDGSLRNTFGEWNGPLIVLKSGVPRSSPSRCPSRSRSLT